MHHYALSYTPLRGVHMRRVPPLGGARRQALRRALLGAAFALAATCACVGVLALGAWLDASDAPDAPAGAAPATVAEVRP